MFRDHDVNRSSEIERAAGHHAVWICVSRLTISTLVVYMRTVVSLRGSGFNRLAPYGMQHVLLIGMEALLFAYFEIGRASCRERV